RRHDAIERGLDDLLRRSGDHMEIELVAVREGFERFRKKLYVAFQTDQFAGFEQMFASNTAKLRIMQNQVRQFRALLDQIDLCQAPNFVMETLHPNQFGEHDSGIVETECLVKIAGQKILLHHRYCPFLVVRLCGPCAAHCDLFAPAMYTLTAFTVVRVTNYFDGCYAQKREQIVACLLD